MSLGVNWALSPVLVRRRCSANPPVTPGASDWGHVGSSPNRRLRRPGLLVVVRRNVNPRWGYLRIVGNCASSDLPVDGLAPRHVTLLSDASTHTSAGVPVGLLAGSKLHCVRTGLRVSRLRIDTRSSTPAISARDCMTGMCTGCADCLHDDISILSVDYSILSIGENVQQDYDEYPRPSQYERHKRDRSGWANGSYGQTEETADVVCTNCWRCVKRSANPSGLHCPRCGASLPLSGGSRNTQRQISA